MLTLLALVAGFNPRSLCPAIHEADKVRACKFDAEVTFRGDFGSKICPLVAPVAQGCRQLKDGQVSGHGGPVHVPHETMDWNGWEPLEDAFGPAVGLETELCPVFNYIDHHCAKKEALTTNPAEVCHDLLHVITPNWPALTQAFGNYCKAPHVLKVSAGEWSGFSYGQWSMVYNILSFGIAGMGSATIFLWLMIANVNKAFKPALAISGIVTFIATYHYFRIFNSWNDGFDVHYTSTMREFAVFGTGIPFNDAYRYVDWLLTVPLLLIELILVMQLPSNEATGKMWKLGVTSALMVAVGYLGEVRDNNAARFYYWSLSMCPFCYVLYELYFGLAEATKRQAPSVASLTAQARYLTAISWLTYPAVYMIKGVGLGGPTATTYEQVGYSIADVVAKAVFGCLIWGIAHEKSKLMEEGK